MTRIRSFMILVVLIALLGGTWYSLLPKYPGDPLITLQLPGTRGGFWLDPFGPNIFHSWWNGHRYYGPVENPLWHWIHPHARELARKRLLEGTDLLQSPRHGRHGRLPYP